jgi:hypothetical protein
MFPPFSLEDLVDLYKEQFKKGRKEKPQRDIGSPWSLHIGSFWKIHFIISPKG